MRLVWKCCANEEEQAVTEAEAKAEAAVECDSQAEAELV